MNKHKIKKKIRIIYINSLINIKKNYSNFTLFIKYS